MYKSLARVRRLRSKVKSQGYQGQKSKNCWVISQWQCTVGGTQQAATDDTIAWPLRVTGYAGGKISACRLVLFKINTVHNDCYYCFAMLLYSYVSDAWLFRCYVAYSHDVKTHLDDTQLDHWWWAWPQRPGDVTSRWRNQQHLAT